MSKAVAVMSPFADLVGRTNIPEKTMANAITAIRLSGIECSYNLMTDRRIVAGNVLGENIGQLSDDICLLFREYCRTKFDFDPGEKPTWDALNLACRKKSFHPVLDYLNGLEWDGIPALETWMIDYLGAADTPLIRHISKMVMVASVRRIKQPGCKYDYMIVLEGPENKGKSYALSLLYGDEFFTDQVVLGASDKEIQEALRGRWAVECAELAGLRKAEVERVKAQITRQADRGRPAYGRAVIDIPRTCVFWGTTNDAEYLRSQTGNRRFIPVRIPAAINLDNLRAARDQLWAEAVALEADGFPLALPEDIFAAAQIEQQHRTKRDPWLDDLADFTRELPDVFKLDKDVMFDRRVEGNAVIERCTSQYLIAGVLAIGRDRQNADLASRLRLCMEKLGWRYAEKPMWIGGRLARGYVRTTDIAGI